MTFLTAAYSRGCAAPAAVPSCALSVLAAEEVSGCRACWSDVVFVTVTLRAAGSVVELGDEVETAGEVRAEDSGGVMGKVSGATISRVHRVVKNALEW